MSAYEPNSRHLREVLFYAFNSKKSAAEAHPMLSDTYGEVAISERTCREWFQRFKNGGRKIQYSLPQGYALVITSWTERKTVSIREKVQQSDFATWQCSPPYGTTDENNTLKWEALPHPLYSPDIAPSDYHLFQSMSRCSFK